MGDKTERITIRLRPQDKTKIKMYAVEHDMKISELFLVAMLKLISQEENKKDDLNCIK